MALLVSKVPFWVFPSKGGFTICDTPKLCSAENTILIVLSAKHSFAEIKECKLKKHKFTKNGGLFANMQKGVFLFVFVCFLVVFILLVCFVFFCLEKKPKKVIFLQFRVLFLFLCAQKACFKIFLLIFLFYFVSSFSFCPPFQNSILFFFFSINPFLENIIILVSSIFLFLSPLPL